MVCTLRTHANFCSEIIIMSETLSKSTFALSRGVLEYSYHNRKLNITRLHTYISTYLHNLYTCYTYGHFAISTNLNSSTTYSTYLQHVNVNFPTCFHIFKCFYNAYNFVSFSSVSIITH